MTTIRSKFRLDTITIGTGSRCVKSQGQEKWESCIVHTLKLSPVYANDDPEHENSKFWDATPSGLLELGCIHPDAVRHMEVGKEYFVDISDAEAPENSSSR